MDSLIELLLKVLDLEKKKGFTDTAVTGGLDRFLANWVVQAKDALDDNMRKQLSSINYAKSNREARQNWLLMVVGLLTGAPKAPVKVKTTVPRSAKTAHLLPKLPPKDPVLLPARLLLPISKRTLLRSRASVPGWQKSSGNWA